MKNDAKLYEESERLRQVLLWLAEDVAATQRGKSEVDLASYRKVLTEVRSLGKRCATRLVSMNPRLQRAQRRLAR